MLKQKKKRWMKYLIYLAEKQFIALFDGEDFNGAWCFFKFFYSKNKDRTNKYEMCALVSVSVSVFVAEWMNNLISSL